MSKKVLCKCGWCLYRNPKEIKITTRVKRRHEERLKRIELDDDGLVKEILNKEPRTKKRR